MTKRPIILFGGNPELMEIAEYYFREDSNYEPLAITMDREFIKDEKMLKLPVLPFDSIESEFDPENNDMFVALGYSKLNLGRKNKIEEARNKGYNLPSYVSSKATIFSNFCHGPNCFILENNTIQPFSKIGMGVTLWSGNHIGHHANIGDFIFVSSHVVISGAVSIGERSFLGVNSTINDNLTIGACCVVGSGALVTKNLDDNSVVATKAAPLSRIPSHRLQGF